MCASCGCGEEDHTIYTMPGESHHHANKHDYHHHHPHNQEHEIQLETDILSKNNMTAERNRGYFEALDIKVLNLVIYPSSLFLNICFVIKYIILDSEYLSSIKQNKWLNIAMQ